METYLECVHSTANVSIAYFFIENQTETMASFSILTRSGERMKFRFDAVFLRSKSQSLR